MSRPSHAPGQFALLIADIDRLEDEGVLNGGRANALRTKIEEALAAWERGRTNAAAGKLNALLNQVEAFMRATRAARMKTMANSPMINP